MLCADVGGAGALANNIEGAESNGGVDVRVAVFGSATMRLRGYTGPADNTGGTLAASIQSYFTARNTITTTSAKTADANFQNTSPSGSACLLP